MFRIGATNYPAYNAQGEEILIHFATDYNKADCLGFVTYDVININLMTPAVIRVKKGCADFMLFDETNGVANLKFLLNDSGNFVAIDDDEYEEPDDEIEIKEKKTVNLVSEVLPRRKATQKPAGFYKETKTKTETKPKSQKQQKIVKKEETQVNLVSEVLPRRKAAIKPAGFYRLCHITV
jgi:hypothetical protein